MTVRVNKPSFNIREKLTELKHKPIELVSVQTPEITTSGSSSYTIDGIHETDHPIYFMLNGTTVGVTNNDQIIRVGTEDGISSSNIYYYNSFYDDGGSNNSNVNNAATTNFPFFTGFNNVNNTFHTIAKIQRLSRSNNRYFMTLAGCYNTGYPQYFQFASCRVDLGKPLTSVQLYSASNFDGGSISLQYIYERNL